MYLLLLVLPLLRLYLHNETNESAPPKSVIQGYRIGSAADDKLRLLVTEGGSSTEHQARIVMPDSSTATKLSSIKRFKVGRVVLRQHQFQYSDF